MQNEKRVFDVGLEAAEENGQLETLRNKHG
jgi:hypothetical protein